MAWAVWRMVVSSEPEATLSLAVQPQPTRGIRPLSTSHCSSFPIPCLAKSSNEPW